MCAAARWRERARLPATALQPRTPTHEHILQALCLVPVAGSPRPGRAGCDQAGSRAVYSVITRTQGAFVIRLDEGGFAYIAIASAQAYL